MRSRPDILVLGGGGVLGEAWLSGVLAGLEDGTGFDLRRCDYFVGTSAGAIVAARLAAGDSPRRPADAGRAASAAAHAQPTAPAHTQALQQLTRGAGEWALAWATPLAWLGLAATAPAGALGRALALRAIGRGSGSLDDLRDEIDHTGARFDGRLRIAAVNRSSGRRVVFGRPSGPAAGVGAAMAASCAVPWMFEPVRIGRQEYVDGGVWSPTNLDAAPAGRDSQVLCLNPTAGLGGSGTGPGRALAAAGLASVALMEIEAGGLRRRGATVETVSPDSASAAEMNVDLMASEAAGRVLAAGYRQGRRLGVGPGR